MMHEIRCHVSAAARQVAIVYWIPSRIQGDAVTEEGRLQHPHGEICTASVVYHDPADQIRYSGSTVNSPLDRCSGYHTPASRDQEYSPVAVQDASFDTSRDSLAEHPALGRVRRSQTAERHGHETQELSPNDMIAPASAVHSMSVNLLGTNEVSGD